MSPLKRLALVVTAASASLRFIQGHSHVEDHASINHPRHGPDFSSFKERRLPTELSTLANGKSRSEFHATQQTEIRQGGDVSLPVGHLDYLGKDAGKEYVKLVIAVPSVRPDRRQTIRETWSNWADDRVVLRFFTEPPSSGEHEAYVKESSMYRDIIPQELGGGMNFGLKLLSAMRWMSDRYSFDFFLRLDDDYFLCLERLLHELECLSSAESHSSPLFAGYRVCGRKYDGAYVDEAYILFSSVVVDRVLTTSNLNCSGFGSLTAGAWLRVGGPGNPEGDVAWVNDYRLDQKGTFWIGGREQYDPVCVRGLGIHHAYPKRMYQLWIEVTDRMNASELNRGDCESLFIYEDDGLCPFTARGVDDSYLASDNVQPCDSFVAPTNTIWCGRQGC